MVGIRIRVRTPWRGRLGLGSRVVGRLGSGVWVSASFHFFCFHSGGNVIGGEGNCLGGGNVRGNMSDGGMFRGNVPHLLVLGRYR